MKRIIMLAAACGLVAILAGCQSPRTSYAKGLIVFCSTSAVGIGFGEYIEVPAGGKFNRVSTNDAPCIVTDGRAFLADGIDVDNSAAVPEGCKCNPCKCDTCKCE